ncbi:Hsp70 family protein, partial [Mycolicibacterium chubuense]|uniref:Hsp70 family protein n=1 Tax=Mycolicibacterium chubuense TaxID=1800 RepID=UPI0006534AC1
GPPTATRRAAPRRRPDVAAVAVPAHWSDAAVAALRAQAPHLHVVSDATAALMATAADVGLPARGVVVLCDLGASGTNITLADAGNDLAVIGQTVRCEEFSGDLVDQALLRHVVDGLDADPSGTSAVASLIDLRAECRAAKERLSDATATALAGPHTTIRVTRAELQAVIAGPLDRLVVALLDLLHRHRVAPAHLAAVVTVGGGARIPLVTQRLSEALRCPVITTPHAQAAAAIGAELIAVRSAAYEAPTALAPAAATMLAPAATPLAWSAEEPDDEAATEFALPRAVVARPEVYFDHEASAQERAHSRRRRSPVWLAGAACVAAVAVAGVVLTAEIARGDGTVATGVSDISTPVATHALEPAAQSAAPPPPDPVTQTVVAAAPAPQPAAAPAPAAPPPQQVVAKQAAPQPAPAPAAPAPAPP